MMWITADNSILVVLKKGDKLIETLTREITQRGIKGGFIAGIGALKDVELGYYDQEQRAYIRHHFQDDEYELIGLNGNIAVKEGNQIVIHAHTVLGRRDFSTFGGHLFEGTVAVTAEIMIMPSDKQVRRGLDQETGAMLMCEIGDTSGE